jgi:hypothetical protein
MSYALEFLTMGEIGKFMRKVAPQLSSLNSNFSATVEKVRRESIPTFPCKVSLQLEKGVLNIPFSLFKGRQF